MNPNTPADPPRPGTDEQADIDAAEVAAHEAAEADAQNDIEADIEAEMQAALDAEFADEAGADAETDAEGDGSPWNNEQMLQAENDDLKDRLIRAVAEMENLRKRTEKEKVDARKFAISKFAEDLLGVGDTMERAVTAVPAEARESSEQIRSVIEGIELTQKSLLNVMERHGVQKIEAAGAKFDPNMHQAVMEVEDLQVAKGMVIEVAATGYMIGDRVLRPAMVVVSKGPGSGHADAAGSESDTSAGNSPKSGRDTLSLKPKTDNEASDGGEAGSVGANDNTDPDTGQPA